MANVDCCRKHVGFQRQQVRHVVRNEVLDSGRYDCSAVRRNMGVLLTFCIMGGVGATFSGGKFVDNEAFSRVRSKGQDRQKPSIAIFYQYTSYPEILYSLTSEMKEASSWILALILGLRREVPTLLEKH